MFTIVAVPLQAQQLTGSFVVVGLLGLVEVVPIIVFGLWGGAVADHYDRRRVIIAAEIGSALCAVMLLVNALRPQPQVWVLFAVGALAVTCESLQRPSLEALVPQFAGKLPHDIVGGQPLKYQRTADGQFELFPPAGLGRWARRLGLGGTQAQERSQWLLDALTRPTRSAGFNPRPSSPAATSSIAILNSVDEMETQVRPFFTLR